MPRLWPGCANGCAARDDTSAAFNRAALSRRFRSLPPPRPRSSRRPPRHDRFQHPAGVQRASASATKHSPGRLGSAARPTIAFARFPSADVVTAQPADRAAVGRRCLCAAGILHVSGLAALSARSAFRRGVDGRLASGPTDAGAVHARLRVPMSGGWPVLVVCPGWIVSLPRPMIAIAFRPVARPVLPSATRKSHGSAGADAGV
jgi:hypothetical protein